MTLHNAIKLKDGWDEKLVVANLDADFDVRVVVKEEKDATGTKIVENIPCMERINVNLVLKRPYDEALQEEIQDLFFRGERILCEILGQDPKNKFALTITNAQKEYTEIKRMGDMFLGGHRTGQIFIQATIILIGRDS